METFIFPNYYDGKRSTSLPVITIEINPNNSYESVDDFISQIELNAGLDSILKYNDIIDVINSETYIKKLLPFLKAEKDELEKKLTKVIGRMPDNEKDMFNTIKEEALLSKTKELKIKHRFIMNNKDEIINILMNKVEKIYEIMKEKKRKYALEYYHKNKPIKKETNENGKIINEPDKSLSKEYLWKKQEIICDCGSKVTQGHRARHNISSKHLKWLETQKENYNT